MTNVRLTKTTAVNMRLASTTLDRLNVNARMASKMMASLAKVNNVEANQFIETNESVRTNHKRRLDWDEYQVRGSEEKIANL